MSSKAGTSRVPDAIAQKRDAIVCLCHEFHVIELAIFGSAVTGAFDPDTSDYDFLVEFDYDNPDYRALRDLFGFKDALESLLGRRVDLVSGKAITNPFLKARVEAQRVDLFAA
jgi:predicted nucleotidyltransferase